MLHLFRCNSRNVIEQHSIVCNIYLTPNVQKTGETRQNTFRLSDMCTDGDCARRAHENKRELHKMLPNWVENEHGNIFLLEFCHKIEPQ